MMKRFSLIKKTVRPELRRMGFIERFFLFLTLTFAIQTTLPVPQNNPYDPLPFHTVAGLNKFWEKKSKFAPSFQISPFYQHASKARDSKGGRVPKGDMLGRWNMIGLFFGDHQAVTTGKTFNFDDNGAIDGSTTNDFPYLSRARRVLDGLQEDTSVGDANSEVGWGGTQPGNIPNPGIAVGTAGEIDQNYSDPANFTLSDDPTKNLDGFFSIPIDYEKMGVRGQFNFDFGFGFGLNVKSGVVDYKQVPTFSDQTAKDTADGSDEAKQAGKHIKTYLMKEDSRTEIFKELGLDVSPQRETTMEDTHLQVYWSFPFDLKDKDVHVVTWIPYISVGVWAPTGDKKKIDQAFSLPTGNDGFIGFTFEGAMNFDFPDMVQVGLGGGATIYGSKDYDSYRVPSHIYQSGIYPWKAKIERTPGTVWYVNASFKADHFVDNMSFYFDYVYLVHQKDSIEMRENATRTDLFKPKMLEEDSRWRSAMIHGGMNYQVTPGLGLGLSFQTHLSGRKVYRNTTILGTINLEF